MSRNARWASFQDRVFGHCRNRLPVALRSATRPRVELLEPRVVMSTTLLGGLIGRQFLHGELQGLDPDIYEFQIKDPTLLDAQFTLVNPGNKGIIVLDVLDPTSSPIATAPDESGALHLSLPGSDDFFTARVQIVKPGRLPLVNSYTLVLAADAAPGDFTSDGLAVRGDLGRNLGTLSDVGILDLRDFVGYLDSDLKDAHDFADTYFFDVPTFGTVKFTFGDLQPDPALLGNPVANFELLRDADNDGRMDFSTETLASGSLPLNDVNHITKTLNAGHYAVLVESSVLATGGSNYKLQLDYSPADNAGSTLATARDIGTLGANGQALRDYLSADDSTDLYRFSTVSGGPFVLTGQLSGMPGGADFQLDLIRDANNNGQIDAGETLASSTNLDQPFTLPGTYFVRVRRTGGEGTYTLTVSNRNADVAGDTLAPGVALNIGNLFAEVHLRDFLSAADPSDIFKFTLTSSGVLDASIPTTDKGTDVDLELIQDKNNNLVIDPGDIINSSRTTGPSGEQTVNSLPAGTYFVRLLRNAGSPAYDLSLRFDSASSSASTARRMSLSGVDSDTIELVDSRDPVDLYKLDLLDGTRLSIALSLLDAPVILSFGQDSDASGSLDVKEELYSVTVNGSSLVQGINVPRKGVYLAKVVRAGTLGTHYGIVFGSGPADNAGNSLADARNLGPLSATAQVFSDFVGNGTRDAGDDLDDFYRFTVGDGGPFVFQGQILAGVTGNVGVALIRDDNLNRKIDAGEVLATTISVPNPPNPPRPPGPIVTTLLIPGTYYMHVFRVSGQASYSLSVAMPSTDTVGNTLATATNLGLLSTSFTASEFVGRIDSADVYRFAVTGPTEVAANLTNADTRLGIEIIRDVDNDGVIDPGESLTTPFGHVVNADLLNGAFLPAGGTYFLRVVPGAADSAYTLNLSLSSQAPFTTPFQINNTGPTRIEAENFDRGGEGVAYHDTTSGNTGNAAAFRTAESIGVDVSSTADVGGGNRIVNTVAGEFLEYTINVNADDLYALEFRVAGDASGAKFHVDIDGVTELLGTTNSSGADSFLTLGVTNFPLFAGPHILRLTMDPTTFGGSSGVYNFINILPASQFAGTFALTPAGASVSPRKHTPLSLAWTVPSGGWRTLKDVDIRLVDDRGIALWVKFDESANTLSLFNPATGRFGPARTVGSRGFLTNKYALLNLKTSTVRADGPTAPTVVLTLDLRFKPRTRHRHFRVEAAASDDLGHIQAFESAGSLKVGRRGIRPSRPLRAGAVPR